MADDFEEDDDVVAGPGFGGEDGATTSVDEHEPEADREIVPGGGVVKIKGKEYAVGLFWNSVEEIPQAAQEAKTMAAREGTASDFYCTRLTGTPQYGLGTREAGHRAGMPSLAGFLGDNRQGSWLGCFIVDAGYYIVAIRDDGIFPGTDKLYLTEEDARAAFDHISSMPGWEAIYAPPAFAIAAAKDFPINNLLIGKPTVKLIDVAGRSRVFWLFAAFIVMGALVFAGFRYNEYWSEQAINDSLNTMRNQGLRNPLRQKVEVPPMPWEGRPQGALFLETCLGGISKMVIDFPGWKTTSYSCVGGGDAGAKSAVVELVRDGPISSINWITYTVNAKGLHSGVTPLDSNRVQVTQPLAKVPEVAIDIQTARIPELRKYLLSQFDEKLTRIDISAGEHSEFFSGIKLVFKTQINPLNYLDILRKVPALLITKVTYDPNSWLWTVEGTAYEQHIPENAAPKKR